VIVLGLNLKVGLLFLRLFFEGNVFMGSQSRSCNFTEGEVEKKEDEDKGKDENQGCLHVLGCVWGFYLTLPLRLYNSEKDQATPPP